MKKALRFCMVTTFYPPYHFGGDGTFVYRLSNGLAQRGHSVEVIHCRDAYRSLGGREPQSTNEYPHHPNVRVHGLESRAGVLSPLWTQQTGSPGFKARSIRRIIARGRFDVIHFHNISLIGGPRILEIGDALKLYTLHEYWLVCPTHVLFKFNREACQKPECLKCTLKYKRPPQAWRATNMIGKAVKNVDAFLAPSRFAAAMHARMGLQIPTVHLPHFVPQPLPLEPDATASPRPYFLFVGRLEKLKGLQDVIPLFRDYHEADLWVVGTGNYEDELRALARGAKNIRFLGALPSEQLAQLYAGALALVVPSRCYETFGQVVVEAFSHRTPVIARDIGALSELITQSGGGILYRSGGELKKALESLQANSTLRDEWSIKGYDAYMKLWTEEHHFDSYLKLIDELMQRK